MNKKEIPITIGKSVISMVPTIGGSITSIISDIQAERKFNRIQELINSLDDGLNEFK